MEYLLSARQTLGVQADAKTAPSRTEPEVETWHLSHCDLR